MNLKEKPIQNLYFIIVSIIIGAASWVLYGLFHPLCACNIELGCGACNPSNIYTDIFSWILVISIISTIIFIILWIYYSIKKRIIDGKKS